MCGKCIHIFARQPEGKKPLGRPRHREEDGVIRHLRKINCDSVDWIHLAY